MESIVEERSRQSAAGGDAGGGVRFSQVKVVEYDDNPYDDSLRAEEPNQFETLCDGVLSAMGLVHASLQEYLDFKDELLQHHLPPNVLLKLSLVSGKLYRSLSDMHMPTNELIRMVRVYSTPWEEKSAALKKLHEDYETKVNQLNVAISKLSLQDTEAKRVARERRVLNWERLFAKVQMAKGHGRRWKFRMHDFKQKAAMGIEHLREYFHVGEDSASEDEMVDPELAAVEEGTPTDVVQDSDVKEEEEDEEEEEVVIEADDEVKIETISDDIQEHDIEDVPGTDTIHPTSYKEYESSPEPPVETTDASVWTEEPECDHYLHVRVFKPHGLKKAPDGIKCVITYGNKICKSGILDAPLEETDKESEEATAAEAAKAEEEAAPKSKRLIGTRKKVTIQEPSKTADQIRKEQEERRKKEMSRYEEFMIEIPESVLGGIIEDPLYESLKVSILVNGQMEELFATGTVDMDDLQSLDAPVRYLPTDRGDCVTPPPPFVPADDPELCELEPVPFPLYPVTGGRGLPAGTIPLACFWTRKEKYKKFHRCIETEHVYELVKDLTGIDLNFITKEELTRAKMDVCLSPRPETPKPVVETVLKEEYDEMMKKHEEQMEMLQKEYEQRLQDMADSLQNSIPTAPENMDRGISPAFSLRPTSGELREAARLYGFRASPSKETTLDSVDSTMEPTPLPKVEKTESEPAQQTKKKKSVIEEAEESKPRRQAPRLTRTLPKWGENLPDDFFERLELFTSSALRHRQELTDRVKAEVAVEIERQLAESYKLTGRLGDEELNRALRGVKDLSNSFPPPSNVTLPAMFMPNRNPSGTVFNPRAHQYFHPSGQHGVRLTQPPSMLHLPPIKNRVGVMNLFDLGQTLNSRTGLDWFSQRAMAAVGASGGEEISAPHVNSSHTPFKSVAQRTIIEEEKTSVKE